jgi:hypothetical protein
MRLQYIIPGKAQDVFAIEQSIYEYFGIVSSHDYIASFHFDRTAKIPLIYYNSAGD